MKRIFLICLAAITLFNSCKEVPITGRKQFALIPEGQLNQLAIEEYNAFLAQNQVVSGTSEANMVSRIGSRMSTAVDNFMKNNDYADLVDDFKWEYHLIQNNEANAWCMSGGKIVVYTGILPVTQTEPGLAVVMGHEIAHAVARHGNERMSQMLAVQLGGVALDVALSQKPEQTRNLFLTAYGIGANLGVILPYSRKHESEADKLGLVFMALAGYNPSEAVTFWQRMQAQSGGAAAPEFLSTHPAPETRIRDIQAYLPKALKYYNQ